MKSAGQLEVSAVQTAEALYTDGRYLEATGGRWHLEDAPFKAKYVRRMLARHGLEPRTVCEVGCGAGGVLAELAATLDAQTRFEGFEISPQAHALSLRFATDRLRFRLEDPFELQETYDLVLALDVVEHVEDCYSFLRRLRDKAEWKIYHFPLEITCLTAARDYLAHSFVAGHLHFYSRSTALAALRHTGHQVIDAHFTPVGLERGRLWRTRLANVPRRILPPSLAARLLGGYSLMVLAR